MQGLSAATVFMPSTKIVAVEGISIERVNSQVQIDWEMACVLIDSEVGYRPGTTLQMPDITRFV